MKPCKHQAVLFELGARITGTLAEVLGDMVEALGGNADDYVITMQLYCPACSCVVCTGINATNRLKAAEVLKLASTVVRTQPIDIRTTNDPDPKSN